MKIKALGVIAILGVLATSNVMASDHKHNKHVNTNKHVVTKHVVTTQHHQPSKKVVRMQSNNSNNKLGVLVTGIIVGSILSAR